MRPGTGLVLAALWATLFTACGLDPYTLGFDGDGGGRDGGSLDGSSSGDGGGVTADARLPDAIPPDDACIPFPETCDGMDNDCDGDVDEDFNLDSDPGNCGTCGFTCFKPNMSGTCTTGTCSFECLPGFVDLDPMVEGCEYACQPTNGGVEACDFADNNCDGEIDEGFNLDTDENNCGGCGRICLTLNASPLCENKICGYSACNDGFADLLAGIPGCEYACPQWPTSAETCDGLDNDCDGQVDDGITLTGDCTDPGFEMIGETGECSFGTPTCSFGTTVCTGYVRPAQEICDNLDNDCNGVADDGFDKVNDPRYCGGCTPCSLPHAIPGCALSACTVVACEAGWIDEDGDPLNGCEYNCTPSGPEVCDGLDNDCDKLTDLADPDLVAPANFCTQNGTCAGTQPVCAAPTAGPGCSTQVTWRCDWGSDVEVDACGDKLLQETLCDDLDGDCDTFTDEVFQTKGTACDDGNIGVCQGTGTFICDPMDPGQLICNVTTPGQMASVEQCNNLDDDCNGTIDDGAPADVTLVDNGVLPKFNMFTYEASRPDATDTAFGAADHRACSTAGVLPWRNVSWDEANAACLASGMRLCTEAEWQLACEGPMGNSYPYGSTYDPNKCNGREYDPDCTGPNDNVCLPTATAYGCPEPMMSSCVSDYGLLDMSGNLMEWTGTAIGTDIYRVKGGSYMTIEQGLTCNLSFIAYPDTFYFNDLGFRCCADAM